MEIYPWEDVSRRYSMKTHLFIAGILWLIISFLPSASIGKKVVSEEYVYLLKLEGGKVHQITEESTGYKKESVKKEIRRMEMISPGTVLEIEKGASVFLTCGECRVLNLTHKDSPFVIKMEDFKKETSTTSKIMECFTMALNNYIHPDKPGSKVRLQSRTFQKKKLCRDLWPRDNADIMYIEPINFRWWSEETHFSLEIKEFGSSAIVYSEKTMLKKIDVPLGILKQGRRYEWSLVEEKTGEKCSASFALLSKDDSNRIMKIVNNLPQLLPPGTDMETRCRLQAGYLVSEGLNYDALKLLKRNGISQQY
jgi:hypothetical protein